MPNSKVPDCAVEVDMVDEKDDDPVVQEYPVYLNRLQDPPAMSGELYVLLNTLRPKERPYGDQGHLSTIELDDENHRIRMKYGLNTRAATYDSDSVYNLREQSLLAKPVPRDANTAATHCVGILHEGSISLIPVTSLCSVRPDLDHVDEEASSRKMYVDDKSSSDVVAAQPASSSKPNIPATTANPLTGKALHYQQLVQSLSGSSFSKWKRLDWYDYDSVEASDLLSEHVLVDTESCRNLHFSCSQSEYLHVLCGTSADKSLSGPETSSSYLSRLGFGKQIEEIMRSQSILSFEEIVSQLPPNTRARYSEQEVLEQLRVVHCVCRATGLCFRT